MVAEYLEKLLEPINDDPNVFTKKDAAIIAIGSIPVVCIVILSMLYHGYLV